MANQGNQGNQGNQANQESDRKPYLSPVVRDYGNIRAITKSVGTTSSIRDSQGGGNNKTA